MKNDLVWSAGPLKCRHSLSDLLLLMLVVEDERQELRYFLGVILLASYMVNAFLLAKETYGYGRYHVPAI